MISWLTSLFLKLEIKVSGETAGVLYQFLWLLGFFGSFLMHKLLLTELTVAQMIASRGIVQWGIMYYLASQYNLPMYPDDRKEEVYRFIRGFAGNVNFTIGSILVEYIPLSEISVLSMVGPNLLGVADYVFNKAPISAKEIISAVAAFAGVFLVMRPDVFYSFFGMTDHVEEKIVNPNYATGSLKALLIGIYFLFSVFWAYSVILLKRVKSINVVTLNLPSGMILTFSAGILSLNQGIVNPVTDYVSYVLIMILGGALGVIIIFTLTRSNQIGKPALNGIMMNLNVVASFIFEVFVFGEPLKLPALIGAAVIISTAVYVNLSKLKAN